MDANFYLQPLAFVATPTPASGFRRDTLEALASLGLIALFGGYWDVRFRQFSLRKHREISKGPIISAMQHDHSVAIFSRTDSS